MSCWFQHPTCAGTSSGARGSDWLSRYPQAVDLPFVVTNASGVHPVQIAEHVFALLLAHVRKLPQTIRNQSEHGWEAPPGETVNELYQRTLLVIGLGAIGERTSRLGYALGMRVIGIRRTVAEPPAEVDALYTPDRLLEVLPNADFVALAAPLTKDTFHMIGERELAAMKPSAFIANIGRGKLINEPALVRALREGRIAGAGLDVFETEPLPPDSPLWSMPNVIVTPHYAGTSPRYHERAMRIFLDNLRRYREGAELRNVVDKRNVYQP